MRKPTFTIDSRAYASTLSRSFTGDQKPGLPSPVPTPKRRPSDAMTLPTASHSFIGDVQDALKRTLTPKPTVTTQTSMKRPASPKEKEKASKKWTTRLSLASGPPRFKVNPDKP